MRTQLRFRAMATAIAVAVLLALGTGVSSAIATAALHVHPHYGPAGTSIRIKGSGYRRTECHVTFSFTDAAGAVTVFGSRPVAADGSVHMKADIPSRSALGEATILGRQARIIEGTCRRVENGRSARVSFTVTG